MASAGSPQAYLTVLNNFPGERASLGSPLGTSVPFQVADLLLPGHNLAMALRSSSEPHLAQAEGVVAASAEMAQRVARWEGSDTAAAQQDQAAIHQAHNQRGHPAAMRGIAPTSIAGSGSAAPVAGKAAGGKQKSRAQPDKLSSNDSKPAAAAAAPTPTGAGATESAPVGSGVRSGSPAQQDAAAIAAGAAATGVTSPLGQLPPPAAAVLGAPSAATVGASLAASRAAAMPATGSTLGQGHNPAPATSDSMAGLSALDAQLEALAAAEHGLPPPTGMVGLRSGANTPYGASPMRPLPTITLLPGMNTSAAGAPQSPMQPGGMGVQMSPMAQAPGATALAGMGLPPASPLMHLGGGALIPATAPLPPQAKSNLYKTEMCRSWAESGSCRYGNKCQFAHGAAELRQVPRHPKYKTEICRTFQQTGTCPYGTRCRFVHVTAAEVAAAAAEVALEEALMAAAAAGASPYMPGSPANPLGLPSALELLGTPAGASQLNAAFQAAAAAGGLSPAQLQAVMATQPLANPANLLASAGLLSPPAPNAAAGMASPAAAGLAGTSTGGAGGGGGGTGNGALQQQLLFEQLLAQQAGMQLGVADYNAVAAAAGGLMPSHGAGGAGVVDPSLASMLAELGYSPQTPASGGLPPMSLGLAAGSLGGVVPPAAVRAAGMASPASAYGVLSPAGAPSPGLSEHMNGAFSPDALRQLQLEVQGASLAGGAGGHGSRRPGEHGAGGALGQLAGGPSAAAAAAADAAVDAIANALRF